MSCRIYLNRYHALAISVAFCVSCFQGPAWSLDNIHDEIWFHPEPIPTAPARTHVAVSFEGAVTANDLADRLRFSILETQPGGTTVTLLEYAVQNLALPPVGTPLRVYVSFTLSCDGSIEQLHVNHSQGNLSFCDAAGEAQPKWFQDVVGEVHSVPRSETFGLAIADENGQLGSLGPDPSALQCGGTSSRSVSAEEALDGLRAKNREAPIIQENGDSGWLGVYFDAEGTQCEGTITPGQPGTVYILAKLNGLTECGAGGAEFRFTGLPDSWLVYPVASPDLFAQGDPFGDGVLAVWPCDSVTNPTVVLYTVLVLATEMEENVEFHLERRLRYTNPMYLCPAFLMCDFPLFSYVCVETSPCYVNFSVPTTCRVPVAVEGTTWGCVKDLYR